MVLENAEAFCEHNVKSRQAVYLVMGYGGFNESV